jgi:hypothetical protein
VSAKAALLAVLKEDGVEYEIADDKDVVRIVSLSPKGDWVVIAQWNQADTELCVYAVCTLAVPQERRAPVMELVTRANFGLRFGCFEMDLDDGELRFRCSADFEDQKPSPSMARALLFTAVATLRTYLPAIADVTEGADVRALVRAVERRQA